MGDPCDTEDDVASAATGGCNAADQANLADAKNVGDKQDACGKQALGLSGIDHDKFTSCAMSSLSISSSCAECYYATATYGFKNCKVACLAGWCKSGCLSCTAPAQDTLGTCAGFTPAAADPCDRGCVSGCHRRLQCSRPGKSRRRQKCRGQAGRLWQAGLGFEWHRPRQIYFVRDELSFYQLFLR